MVEMLSKDLTSSFFVCVVVLQMVDFEKLQQQLPVHLKELAFRFWVHVRVFKSQV